MKFHRAVIFIAIAPALGGCYGLYGHDEMERYAQRADVITMSAGDAKQVNAVAHMNTPWPYYVGDRRIPVAGERMQRAADRYLRPKAAGGQAQGGGAATGTGAAAGGGTAQ